MSKGGVWLIAALVCMSACGADDDDTGGAGAGGPGGSGGAAGAGPALTGECAGANVAIGGPMLHANALAALSAMASSCGASTSCHQGMHGKAMLTLLGQTDLKTLLVGKMSCEVPTIPLVDAAGNAAGLSHSWLWIKLTHPSSSSMELVPDPTWGMAGNCGQQTPGSFGFHMPWGLPASSMWPDLNKVRDWICAGAPGP